VHLSIADVDANLLLVETPFISGAGNWIAWLDFTKGRLSSIRIRIADSVRIEPARSPRTSAPNRGLRADYFFALIAETLVDERTNIVPFDRAGVAISSSPIELVARCLKVRPAWITRISPSSFDR
jgi:hypothetical protein